MGLPYSKYQDRIDAILTEELLNDIRDRAAGYDAHNEFPHEDLAALKQSGYLAALTPIEDGGLGWDFATVVDAQKKLAAYAPATALAVNMHLIWSGVAWIFRAHGNHDLDFILKEAAAGEIYAFGISEAGNDAVLFDSETLAEDQSDGSVRFTGTKIFTTLSPVWTRLGVFGKSPDGSELIYAIVDREAGNTESDGSRWDMLGMRATQSFVTKLDGVSAPADRVIRRIPTGPNQDLLTFAIFAAFLTFIAAVYAGIGDRAVQIAAEKLHTRRSKVHGTALSQDPILRYKHGEAILRQMTQDQQLSGLAEAITQLAEYGDEWFTRLVANKISAVRVAKAQVDYAFEASGGAGYHRTEEIARLYRDVMAGVYHPSNDESAHTTFATFGLGPLED
ncbi:acyl-CoA dehydrogenase family protein [Enteractinococcus coprophilus]|uniref:Alkylation response protein AidB-like acyl-CoA dehydrogenase n=1 Tax=Enteractinococcus coprophilus TaxID=1027633 RepID=A0A543AJA4_9MICC|nr:acyl-CoA dehydrogenase family protein [Enteractinococcus coprophilus]TQL72668.1 alkylation response protein AidB-like acyl-CoA dehydrogenase [Enteractinococcus coprophilus]